MPSKTALLGNHVGSELKRKFDETADFIGIGSTAAFTVLMKGFVADGGFPFDVRIPTPTKEQFVKEMSARYERMLSEQETEYDLVEV